MKLLLNHHKGHQRRSRQRDARTLRQQEPTVYTATGFGDPQTNGRLSYAQNWNGVPVYVLPSGASVSFDQMYWDIRQPPVWADDSVLLYQSAGGTITELWHMENGPAPAGAVDASP